MLPRLTWAQKVSGILAAVALAILLMAMWPVRTYQAVNYRTSTRTIRLYEKAVDFISRDLQTRRLVKEIVAPETDKELAAVTLFHWVRQNVRPTPEGFPVVDDHVLHVIIRGYGAPDQRAEAFALLSSYAGLRSGAAALGTGFFGSPTVATFVEIDGELHFFDVNNGISLHSSNGSLADVGELLASTPTVGVEQDGRKLVTQVSPAFAQAVATLKPDYARMDAQRPWKRLRRELGEMLRREAATAPGD